MTELVGTASTTVGLTAALSVELTSSSLCWLVLALAPAELSSYSLLVDPLLTLSMLTAPNFRFTWPDGQERPTSSVTRLVKFIQSFCAVLSTQLNQSSC